MPILPGKDNPGGSGWGALATTVGTGLFGFIGGRKRQEREFAFNKEAQERAYQQNLEQWEREKQYNDPSQQMARLKAAGLNPNLVYGSGSATTVAPSSPKKEAAKASFHQPKLGTAEAIQTYQNARLAAAQVNSIEENTRSAELDNQKRKIDLGSTSFQEIDTKVVGNQTIVKIKVANRYKYEKDLELQQKQQNLDTGKLNQQVSRMAARLAQFNISVSDKLLIKQIVLYMDKQKLDISSKQSILTAIAALSR